MTNWPARRTTWPPGWPPGRRPPTRRSSRAWHSPPPTGWRTPWRWRPSCRRNLAGRRIIAPRPWPSCTSSSRSTRAVETARQAPQSRGKRAWRPAREVVSAERPGDERRGDYGERRPSGPGSDSLKFLVRADDLLGDIDEIGQRPALVAAVLRLP